MADASLLRPRLRSVEVFPTQIGTQSAICLRDPSGLAEHAAFLPRAAALVLAFCDGEHSQEQIAEAFAARTGARVDLADLARLIEQLDAACFLVSERSRARGREIAEAYHAAPLRLASHAGGAYPGGADELKVTLAGWQVGTSPARLVPARGAPAVLVAPHIDFHRGGPMYGKAYQTLPAERPDLVVIFGTDHNGVEHPFTLTRKGYDTPLGPVATDEALVNAIADQAGADEVFADELHHRNEHSVEFQAVWLRHLYGADAPPILPVLCGSVHRAIARGVPVDDPRVGGFLDALRRLTEDRRVLVVAGADFAHVGPRFGDGPMGNADARREVERADQAAIAAARLGDAAGFFRAIADEKDRFRICGLAPIYAALEYANRRGEGAMLGYQQCAADEEDQSFVSIAAIAL